MLMTKTGLKKTFPYIFSAPYCSLTNLLSCRSRIGYTKSKTYGWRSDIYYVSDITVISTGYGPVGTPIPQDVINKYEALAKEVNKNTWDYNKRRVALNELINQLEEEMISMTAL